MAADCLCSVQGHTENFLDAPAELIEECNYIRFKSAPSKIQSYVPTFTPLGHSLAGMTVRGIGTWWHGKKEPDSQSEADTPTAASCHYPSHEDQRSGQGATMPHSSHTLSTECHRLIYDVRHSKHVKMYEAQLIHAKDC